ncbi:MULTISPECIES: helix-turn-helix domain-containing protein [Afifella]|uniref:helix-turn-helix domain-containing protein n=1 Tax=Afifella TaxID=643217 RepID=UPI000FE3F790|nr:MULTISPECIES: helix-turn-helix transcriptional regulator [Afifella]MCT8268822.1 helix-turn-helix transcriptional regulator [Afifella sp. JA880]
MNDKRKPKSPDEIDAHIGRQVRMRRKMAGLSQEKLGEQLGVTFQQIQKYEKGANRIAASRLFQIAEVLGSPLSYFLPDNTGNGGEEGFAERQTAFVMDFVSTAEGVELNRSFTHIKSSKVRRRLIELVSEIARDQSDEPSQQ